ncbi:O-acetyltransferase OatA [BD1-7 clade bacterium]|uniref:O-acetyltransferase OatA n=1 Tax=BD1-7 clade bacterium TaxID=2029982 RepID=A0A5S9PLH2_9GAMM|nr:O-acetyltransferase OatA [BD1-7 clade bacterium]
MTKFRKDINGLRAIAVAGVMVFHFQPTWLTGGFAGVDVFFVISGFLMTSIIFRSLDSGQFSYTEYLSARINRIVPPLLVLCAVLLAFGFWFLPPSEYSLLSKHVLGSIGFVSNGVYLTEAGYFDSVSHDKWLLHTWSLSVEWQFYLLYPLVLWGASRILKPSLLKAMIPLGVLLSFGLCVFVSHVWPSGAFYLLPARAWEMLLGGMAFLFPVALSAKQARVVFYSGLAMIVGSFAYFSSKTLWPGYWATIPAIGTYLIIMARCESSVLTNVNTIQSLGRWSYSIYLWHWPIAVLFFKLGFNTATNFVPQVVLSILLGFVSFRYVERFRFAKRSGFLRLVRSPVNVICVCILTCAVVVFEFRGMPDRVSAQTVLIERSLKNSPMRGKCHAGVGKEVALENTCVYFGDTYEWAIVGDSHVVELAYALAKRLETKDIGLKHFSYGQCSPSYQRDDTLCSDWYSRTIKHIIDDPEIDTVVVNHRYALALFGENAEFYPEVFVESSMGEQALVIRAMDDLIRTLAANKKRVIVLGPTPELGHSIRHYITRQFLKGDSLDSVVGTDRSYFDARTSPITEYFGATTFPSNVDIVDIADIFCDEATCYAIRDGKPLYYDDDHPSLIGAARMAERIRL